MEAVYSTETLASIHNAIRRHISEDGTLLVTAHHQKDSQILNKNKHSTLMKLNITKYENMCGGAEFQMDIR
jgi:hypothetical protein